MTTGRTKEMGSRTGAATWLAAARPKTLAAAVVPVAVGTALAARLDDWRFLPALLCLVFALLVQIGTNFANDYFDFRKGADTPERVGPTRMVAAGRIAPSAMLRAALLAFGLSFLAGINLVFYGGWWLVPVGLLSIACGFAYTAGPFPLAYNGLGDLFVSAFFGLIAVAFTFFVQTGFFVTEAWLAGASVGFLAGNILVVNNYRDRETDEKAGKKTLAVLFGRRFSIAQYQLQALLAFIVPVLLWARGYGFGVLVPVVLLPVALGLGLRLRHAGAVGANAILARTAALLLIYGLLLVAGLIWRA